MGGLEATLLQAYAARERLTTVLVAATAAREGLEALRAAAEAGGGRVIRRGGNELVALFATPDAAAAAAARMQREAARLPAEEEAAVRAAFHCGPVRQRGHDVYGDTVNLTAELASRAAAGQILASREAAANLRAELRGAVRPLPSKAADASVGELAWRELPGEGLESAARRRAPGLHLVYRYNTLVRRRQGDSLTIGRDPDCDLCIDMRFASRRHCTLELRRGNVHLRDHSTNGTFITVNGERELRIRTEEIVLHGRGWLSFGASRLLAEELVQFRCE